MIRIKGETIAMLYPKSHEPALSRSLFEHPTSEYRATPFWAWNGKLVDDTLRWQIDMLKTMGMGGFHMHVRTGMDSPYLDEEFMGHVRACVEKARDEHMLAWLYDEDRWPSGTAGGKVTSRDPAYAMQTILLTVRPYEADDSARTPEAGSGQRSQRQENGRFVAAYDVTLDENGNLAAYRRIDKDDPAQGVKWYAYVEHAVADPWFNDHPYADTLSQEAVDAFIDITHEAYAKAFSDDFGATIPAIFTDEPKVGYKVPLSYATDQTDVFFPWTGARPAVFKELYGEDVLDRFPELVWELPKGQVSLFRYRFHNMVADRFADNYCGRIGRWCDAHGIKLTGHCYMEPTLKGQTNAMGDAMRCYPNFGIPGIDMLCDFHEYTTAKQAQSIVRQDGKEGMLSELYGVTGWDYDFRGDKLLGDWQAALGVTVRVPHLTWMTMKGEAKRDYPASIGYQSPWWDQFSMVENHFARLNTALTRGKAVARVAVVHPIESYWLRWGPMAQTEALRDQMETQFRELTEYLLFGLIDFDFISEACLPRQCPKGGNPLKVGNMAYDAVIVCGSKTLRATTMERLEAFRDAGGQLIFIGQAPDHVDALPSDRPAALMRRCTRLDFNRTALLEALEPLRFLDVRDAWGRRAEILLYQQRTDGDGQWLFVANGKNPETPDVEHNYTARFIINGVYCLTEYDTLTGEIRPRPARVENGKTVFERVWHMHDSMLLRLEAGEPEAETPAPVKAAAKPVSLCLKPVPFELTEPNMLLLDMAEYALDGGEWHGVEEILRIDNAARAALGIPLRRKEVLQPYLIAPETPEHCLDLRFTIPSEIDVTGARLALEEPEQARIALNGQAVDTTPVGWFVDRDIKTVDLPPLVRGENMLEIRVPIGKRTNLEAFYLLGNFGVDVRGVVKTIVPAPETLGFGSVTGQGFPFYTGCVEYQMPFEADGGQVTVRVPHYRGGLVKVFVDGEDRGNIAFSPCELTVHGLTPGHHTMTLRLYGTRINGFGQLHHTQGLYYYQSPNSWRSTGDLWTYEYQLKPMGILKSPELWGGRFI